MLITEGLGGEMLLRKLVELGAISPSCACTICKTSMSLVIKAKSLDGMVWKCPKCYSTTSIRRESFFDGIKLPFEIVLGLIYNFMTEKALDDTCSEFNVSKGVVIKLHQKIRNIMQKELDELNQMLGGNNIVVQADESLIHKRKYNRGRIIPQKWVIGMIDSVTKDAIIKYIPTRDRNTIRYILCNHLRDDSIFVTDCWKAYDNMFPTDIIRHETVNHSQNFVNPATGYNTQLIENLWMRLKNFLRSNSYRSTEGMESYISEFLWKRKFGTNAKERFNYFVTNIKNYNI